MCQVAWFFNFFYQLVRPNSHRFGRFSSREDELSIAGVVDESQGPPIVVVLILQRSINGDS